MRSSFRRALLVFVLLTAPYAAWILASGPTYAIDDLGPAGTHSVGRAINAGGVVAGSTRQPDFTYRAFTHDPLIGALPVPSGERDTQALGINAGGTVVGVVAGDDGLPKGFRFDPSAGTFLELPTFGGGVGRAHAVNDAGVVVGYAQDAAGVFRAFKAGAGDPPTEVPGFGSQTFAYDISNAGHIVGESEVAGGSHAFLTQGGPPQDLGTLGGARSFATAVNASGQVVGTADRADGLWHAFRVDGLVMSDLGTLGGPVSGAEDINGSGAVVGWSMTASGETHAFLHTDADGMVDLNDLLPPGSGWTLAVAHAINDDGQITGYGFTQADPSGRMHAFRLTPQLGETVDTTAPTIQSAVPDESVLWPPNHQMVTVSVSVTASDDSGAPPTCAVDPERTESSEPDAGLDAGDVPHDIGFPGGLSVALRAERAGGGAGRVYTVGIVCSDAAGNDATFDVRVAVPHSTSSGTSTPSSATRRRSR